MSTDPLVKALQRGDLGAIESLYDAHADDVLRWVVRLGGPHLSAEDVAHEVFVQAIRSACRFRGESSVRTWLFGITRGTVANARRRSALRRFVGLDRVPEPHGTDRPADHLAIAAQERRLLQSCLDELTTRQREVLVLVDLEELSTQAAAEMLKIPAGTVYSRLHGARKALRRALDARGWSPAGSAENVVLLRRPR